MFAFAEKIELEAFFTIAEQTELFLKSVVMGAVFGIIYDVFRSLRAIFPPLGRRIPTMICDILFFLICGMGVYIFSMLFARGEVRAYYCLGAGLGMIIYLLTVGTVVIGIIRAVFGTIYKLLSHIASFIIRPFKKIFHETAVKVKSKVVLNAEKLKKKSQSKQKDLKNTPDLLYNDGK